MRKISIAFGLTCILFLSGSVTAFHENLTPSMGGTYDEVFQTPDLSHAWSSSYTDPFQPLFASSMWSSYTDAFATPSPGYSFGSNTDEVFQTPDLSHAWSSSYTDPFQP
ncbi:MAG: hypothetical protein QFX32_08670, partial [Methanolinea sp.]|nr:hypothetical protein [Methanolinea sp.]